MPLTPEDIQAIREAIAEHPPTCLMGLSQQEVSSLKRFLKATDTTAGWIGKIIVTFFVVAFLGIVTKGFWVSIIQGIKEVKVP